MPEPAPRVLRPAADRAARRAGRARASRGRRCCTASPASSRAPGRAHAERAGAAALRTTRWRPWLVEGAAVGLLGLRASHAPAQPRQRPRACGARRRLRGAGAAELRQLSEVHPPAPAPRPQRRMSSAGTATRPGAGRGAIALLRRADTLFIASASAARPGRRAPTASTSRTGAVPRASCASTAARAACA